METTDWTSAIDLKQPIAGQAHAWIKRAILTLELKPNEALSEKELALKFGISRTPVREALIKLADEGLVDIFPQRGTYVSPIRMPEVIEAQFIREALETAVVRKAAQTADTAFKARLRANLAQQQAAVADERPADFMQLDEAFHREMSDFCSMPRGWRVIQSVKGQLDRVRYLSLPHPGHTRQLFLQHEAICQAIEAGDVEVAVDQMSHHLREVFKTVDELMRERPSLFA